MGRRWKARRQVVPLEDRYARLAVPATPAPGAAGQGPWHVVILTTARRDRLYTAMTRDLGAKVYGGRDPFGGYQAEHAIDRLVLVETYACRHTAFARMQRIRAWPVAERKRLVEASNPGWADLSPGHEEGSQADAAWDPLNAAARRAG
jgi:predicted GIY-YIG superfamily endonuclease